MRNRIIGIVIIILLLAGGYLAINTINGSGGQLKPTPVPTLAATSSNVVSAEGIVIPAQHTTLAFKMAGRIIEIPVREGDPVKAGSVLARLDDMLLQKQADQAQAALMVAQRQLAQLRAGGTAVDRKAASDALAAAQAAYAKLKAGPTAEDLAPLKAALDNSRAALAQAQFRYDRIGGAANPFGGAAPEALALEQAWNANVAAEAAYRNAQSHPTDYELKAAQSAVTQAESALARLDPSPESIALAEAEVAQAQTGLDLAKTALQDATLVAPFDGTVANLGVDVGQVISPGAPAMSFGNVLKLQVETTDLSEVDISQVSVGREAVIKLDALPTKSFHGRVVRISPVSNDYRGDTVYKVTIDLLDALEGLRWGMTANVDISTGM